MIRKAKKGHQKRMGHWKIDIEGQGPHNNESYPGDVDKLVDQFLLMLKKHGHNLHRASITTGIIQKYKNLTEIS